MKKRIITILTALLLLITNIQPIAAVTGTSSVSVSSSSVTVGSKTTISVTLKCSSGIGGGMIDISYDSDYFGSLTLTSGSSATLSSSSNRILLEPTTSTSVTITFTLTTKTVGEKAVTVKISDFIDYDGNDCSGYTKSFSKTITIKEKSSSTSSGSSSGSSSSSSSGSSSSSSSSSSKSKDADLSSLSIEGIELTEEFVSDTYEYTAYATLGTTSLNITAVANNSKATVNDIDSTVEEGWNEVEVTVTSESGAEKTYLINVYVEETPTITFNEGSLGVVKNLDLVEAPEGFEAETITVNEEEVTVFTQNNTSLIYLSDSENEKGFYVYDVTNNEVIALYQPITLNSTIYMAVSINYEEDYLEMSSEYFEAASFTIDGVVVNGWKYTYSNMADYQLIVLTDLQGNTGIYSYDTIEGTLQRFTLPQADETEIDYQQMLITYGLPSICVVCLIASVITLVKARKLRKTYRNS